MRESMEREGEGERERKRNREEGGGVDSNINDYSFTCRLSRLVRTGLAGCLNSAHTMAGSIVLVPP